jgi:hypothetical protein
MLLIGRAYEPLNRACVSAFARFDAQEDARPKPRIASADFHPIS